MLTIADKGGGGGSGEANADNHLQLQGELSCMCKELFPITSTVYYN